jgi:hypothetical protein
LQRFTASIRAATVSQELDLLGLAAALAWGGDAEWAVDLKASWSDDLDLEKDLASAGFVVTRPRRLLSRPVHVAVGALEGRRTLRGPGLRLALVQLAAWERGIGLLIDVRLEPVRVARYAEVRLNLHSRSGAISAEAPDREKLDDFVDRSRAKIVERAEALEIGLRCH